VYKEWFNKIEIPENKLDSYKVIFLYRNPIDVIFSRFVQKDGPYIQHLQNIMCLNNGNIGLGDIIKFGKDLYGLEEFFDNYTIPKKRNYVIHCIKYEKLFSNFELFNKVLNIPDINGLHPIKKERQKKISFINELSIIYKSLMIKMNKQAFIEIIRPIMDDKSNDV
jgi:hypothetical protein